MTSRRLPETDIANISVLPERDQYARLKNKRAFRPPHSLEPTRRCLNSLFGVSTPMFPDATIAPEDAIKALRSSIKRDQDRAPNLLRARSILNFREACVTEAAAEAMRSHRISIDNSINLTHSLVVEINDRPQIPFIDLRKSGSLSKSARDFVFSMNYHLLIDANPDFAEFGLMILNYWEESASNFGLTPHWFNGVPKYSYEQLTDMIARTYQIWLDVLDERKRSDPDEGIGPLFA